MASITREQKRVFKKYIKPYLKLTLEDLNWFQKILFIREVRKHYFKGEFV